MTAKNTDPKFTSTADGKPTTTGDLAEAIARASGFEIGAVALPGPRHLGCKYRMLSLAKPCQALNGSSGIAVGNSVNAGVGGIVHEIQYVGDLAYRVTIVENRPVVPGAPERRVVGFVDILAGAIELAVPFFENPSLVHERAAVLEARAAVTEADQAARRAKDALARLTPPERSSVTGAA